MACFSIAAFVLYGFGVPIAFGAILWSKRNELQNNDFSKSFGFLATKMRTEYYWWEVLISFRKLALVAATKFSDGQRLPCALINLFVAVTAFGTQLYFLPFANDDANLAESLTLLSTILILVLGLAQKTKAAEDLTDEIDMNGSKQTQDFLDGLNIVIYVLMFGMVGASIFIVLRRLRGAMHNWQHLSLLEDAENDGRQIPDEVRQMLHKKWLLVASSWAAIEADQANEDVEIKVDDRVRLANGPMGSVHAIKQTNGVKKYVIKLSAAKTTQNVEVEAFPFDRQMERVDESATTTTTQVRVEQVEVRREELAKEGDIERMERLFRKFKLFQKTPPVQRWAPIHRQFDDFFPEKDRRAMYILAATADVDDIEDLVWVMQQLKNMADTQHTFTPKCCARARDKYDVTKPNWVLEALEAQQRESQTSAEGGSEAGSIPSVTGILGEGLLLTKASMLRTTWETQPHVTDLRAATRSQGNFRQSISQRESRLEAFLEEQQQQEDRDRQQKGRSCTALYEYCAELFFGTRSRSALTAFMLALSVFLTVFCLVHIVASTEKTITGEICQNNGLFGDGSAVLIYYWSFLLGVCPVMLLWYNQCKQWLPEDVRERISRSRAAAQIQAAGNAASNFVRQSTSLLQAASLDSSNDHDGNGIGMSQPSSPGLQPEPEPEPASWLQSRVSERANPAAGSGRTTGDFDEMERSGAFDTYEDNGVDNPNWKSDHAAKILGGAE